MRKRSAHDVTFLILTSLASGSQHGYGIITDVETISERKVRLGAGTLYAALERLREEGLIQVDREEVVDSRLRRYYRLTAQGGTWLSEEAARMRASAQVAIKRLKANPVGGMATA
ncbi:MAG: PadR family transcriptional regulator [Solirubrobacteraceae bacterium]